MGGGRRSGGGAGGAGSHLLQALMDDMEYNDTYYGELVHFQGKLLCHFHCWLPYKLGSSHKGKSLLP